MLTLRSAPGQPGSQVTNRQRYGSLNKLLVAKKLRLRREVPGSSADCRSRSFPAIVEMVTTRSSGIQPNGALAEKRGPRKRQSEIAVGDETATKKPKLRATTDRTRWRMLDDEGRHTWHYLEDDKKAQKWPQSYADKYYLGLPLVGTA